MKRDDLKSKSLNDSYKEICMEYVRQFVSKHGYRDSIEELLDAWVAGDVGTIICIGDMFVDFEVIRYDIDNDIPEPVFEKWYWEMLSNYCDNRPTINYKTYCRINLSRNKE